MIVRRGSIHAASAEGCGFRVSGTAALRRVSHLGATFVRPASPALAAGCSSESTLAQAMLVSPCRWRRGTHIGRCACEHRPMRLADLSRLAAELDGVAEHSRDGLLDWRYHGRLVARQL